MVDISTQIIKLKEKVDYYTFYTQFDVISDSIRQGSGNTYWCLCPFHKDSTPSFQINMTDGHFVCWSKCVKAGDIIDFYMHYYKVSKMKAIIDIAKWAGFELELDEDYKEELERKKELATFNIRLLKHFQENLQSSETAKEYLADRGILRTTIQTFRLGYFDPKKIFDFISEEEYEVAVKCGVLKKNDDGSVRPFSKVPRLIFPYLLNGFPLTFTSRALSSDVLPKYLNFNNNEFVKKEELIFGIDTAKDAIEEYKKVIIAEGQFDCMKAWQKGIKNTVAVSGIKMSESQILKLKKFTKEFVLCIEDKSSAKHIKSSNEGIKNAIAWSKVKVLRLFEQDKCDLDDYLTQNSKADFLNEVEKALPYNEFIVEENLKRAVIKDTEDKIRFINKLKEHLLSVKSRGERDEYIRRISETINYPVESINKDLRNKEIKNIQTTFRSQAVKHDPILVNMQKCFIALLFYDIDVFTIINKFEKYNISEFFDTTYLNIYVEIVNSLDRGEDLRHIRLRLETDPTHKEYFMECISKLDIIILEEDELDDYIKSQIKLIKERRIK